MLTFFYDGAEDAGDNIGENDIDCGDEVSDDKHNEMTRKRRS